MSFEKLCFELAKLSAEDQNKFFESLEGVISESEKTAIQTGIAYIRLQMFPDLKKAIQSTIAKTLYTEFNKKEV